MIEGNQLEKGKCYVSEYKPEQHYIMRAIGPEKPWRCDFHMHFDPHNELDRTFTGEGDFSYVKIHREATYEEQLWLERCIWAGKLVEKPISEYQIF